MQPILRSKSSAICALTPTTGIATSCRPRPGDPSQRAPSASRNEAGGTPWAAQPPFNSTSTRVWAIPGERLCLVNGVVVDIHPLPEALSPHSVLPSGNSGPTAREHRFTPAALIPCRPRIHMRSVSPLDPPDGTARTSSRLRSEMALRQRFDAVLTRSVECHSPDQELRQWSVGTDPNPDRLFPCVGTA